MRVVFHGRDTGFLAAFAAVLFLDHPRSPGLPRLCSRAFQLLAELNAPRGRIVPVGRDNEGNLVCLLGRGREKRVVVQALIGYSSIFFSREVLVFFNLSGYENCFLQLGGALYRCRLYNSASRILRYGIRLEFDEICQGIADLSRRIGRGTGSG